MEFKFVKWLDNKRFALIRYMDKIEIIVPRSRLIPHPSCELEARMKGIHDVNKIVEYCAEKSSLFGFPLFRYLLDKIEDYRKKGYSLEDIIKKGIREYDYDKAYFFKPTCNLLKLRELIVKGVETEKALKEAGCK